LTSTVGLDPGQFSDYCRSHMATFGEDVIDLAERHPSGCEVLCVPDGVLDGHRLRLLIGELRRFYDLILIDCPPGDRWLADSAFDSSEFSLLVGLPTDESARAAVPWSDMSWRYGLHTRFGLIVNRVTAAGSIPQLLPAAFANSAVIPKDASHGNALELPWVLRPDSRAGRTLSEMAGRLVPDLASKDQNNAA
jgi:MinD-like ATPase involved in chromosome partitioning or flagellar assembly